MRWFTGAPELRIALVVSWVLVLARSATFVLLEHEHFDSDQAVIGLMAKHLSEGRAFPLFYYGQPYLLAVEAWLAVPFFWIAGPTVAALRALLIVMNIGLVSMLIIGLYRWGGLRPYLALVAALFVVVPTPRTALELLGAAGGSIEPLLWVLLLWFVRERPFWFGAVLAIGFLNREFVLYAIPVLVAGQLWSRSLFRTETFRAWLFSLIAFLAVFQSVHALVPLSSPMGPGTRGVAGTSTGSQMENLSQRAWFEVQGLPARMVEVLASGTGGLLGGQSRADSTHGRRWVSYLLGFALIAALFRLSVILARRPPKAAASFAWYLLGVGVIATLAFAVARPVGEVVERYILLSLFIPAGLTALWLSMESERWVRHAVIGLALVCAGAGAIDHGKDLSRYMSGTVTNPFRELAATLEARGISVAEAPYWRAYKLTFMTGERIKVASTDVVRVTEYQHLAQAEGDALVRISESPCDGGERVGVWYLCGGAR